MKKLYAVSLIRIFVLTITFSFVLSVFPGRISAQQNDINFQVFYDQLNPYGQWVEDPNYGYVWIPTAGPDFTPYLSNGYWVLTDYGWMWASEYDWGWAAFHYGRWDYNSFYGWFWVPDNEWGPSWVTWRRSSGYYGWAPMRPGVSISVTFGRNNDVPYDRWVFVRDRDIERHDIGRNYMDRKNNRKFMNNSIVINKTYYDRKRHTTYVAGPGREDVQKITGRTIKPVAVRKKDKPGQSLSNDRLQIYMPQVQKNNNGHKPAPLELTNYKDIKRISKRGTQKLSKNIQLQNSKAGKEQQHVANLPNKVKSGENTPQQRKTNSPNYNLNNVKPHAVNSANKIDTKEHAYQPRKLNPSPSKNSKDQTPELRNTNPPKDKSMDKPTKSNKPNDDKKENKRPK